LKNHNYLSELSACKISSHSPKIGDKKILTIIIIRQRMRKRARLGRPEKVVSNKKKRTPARERSSFAIPFAKRKRQTKAIMRIATRGVGKIPL
jgi:hypothetical protein